MPVAKQLDGQVFGRLTVIERFRSRNGRVTWLCLCECGKLHEAVSHALTSGHTKSCGCWRDERNISTPPIHGHQHALLQLVLDVANGKDVKDAAKALIETCAQMWARMAVDVSQDD